MGSRTKLKGIEKGIYNFNTKSIIFTIMRETSRNIKELFFSLKKVYFVKITKQIFESMLTIIELSTSKINIISNGLKKKNKIRGIKFNCFILIVRIIKKIQVIS